jgi:uncharacterized cupin superfamily protein
MTSGHTVTTTATRPGCWSPRAGQRFGTPRAKNKLEPGDLICLAAGPGGAYQVSNHSADPVRMLRLATQRSPTVVVFPDTEKLELTADDASVQLNLPKAL